MKPRPRPGWRIAFLRALAKGLSIAQAAREAGIDPSSVHRVRQRDPGFGALWAKARERGVVRLSRGEPALALDEVVRASRDGRSRIQRAGPGRWSMAKEQMFLEELATTGNVSAAAAMVGISLAALYKRKHQWPGFPERWRVSLREGWERVEAMLVRAAADTLDPPPITPAREPPAMTIDQAINLWKAHRAEVTGMAGGRRGGAGERRRAEPSMEEVRAEVLRRVKALGG